MNIYAIGTIFVELTLGMNAFITAQGFAKTGMYSVLIGAVSNIILDRSLLWSARMYGDALATTFRRHCLVSGWLHSYVAGRVLSVYEKRTCV